MGLTVRPFASGIRAMSLMLGALLVACLGDPVGQDQGLTVAPVGLRADSVLVGSPGEALPTIVVRAVDAGGRPVGGATVTWESDGTGSRVDRADPVTDRYGNARASWMLGIRANETQNLHVQIHTAGHLGTLQLSAAAHPSVVARLLLPDSLNLRLGLADTVNLKAVDPYGNTFVPMSHAFQALDTLLAVDSLGVVRGRGRGHSRIEITGGSVTDTVPVHVTQVVASISLSSDTIRFTSLGLARQVTPTLIDDLGAVVRDSVPDAAIDDTSTVELTKGATLTLKSILNGDATLTLQAGVISRKVALLVNQLPVTIAVAPKQVTFDALLDTVHVVVSAADSLGVAIPAPTVTWVVADTSVAFVDDQGLLSSRRNGTTLVVSHAATGPADTAIVSVTQVVSKIVVPDDSISFSALGAARLIGAATVDRLGSLVAGAQVTYSSTASSVAAVDTTGVVRSVANGSAVIIARYGVDSAVVHVSVQQRPIRIVLATDTIRFVALGETQSIGAVAVDSLGFRVAGSIAGVTIQDTAVVNLLDSVTLHSRQNGITRAGFTEAGLLGSVPIVVQQVPDSVVAVLSDSTSILSQASGTPLPLTCTVLDRNRQPIVGMVVAAAGTSRPIASGVNCGALSVARSGLDTLTLTAGAARTRIPVAVAIPASLTPGQGADIGLDSFPANAGPWAPTARVNSRGQVELYSTAYIADSTIHHSRGSLYRFVSNDGVNFKFDSMVVANDNPDCNLNGSGVENIAIVPRSDSAGWRMFYSSGSFTCYGWQVFSAVSGDERHWTKEGGVRLPNGAPLTGDPPTSLALWPSGEGIVPEQLPDGTWRIFSGTYEHLNPPQVKFQITEWTSPDQMNWTYVQPVLTTRQLPATAQRSVYSPTIVQFAPGLWRMVFTGDNLNVPGGQSTLWSAVSTDEIHWQSEGQLLSTVGVNYYYSTIAAGKLYFLREIPNVSRKIEYASIAMP